MMDKINYANKRTSAHQNIKEKDNKDKHHERKNSFHMCNQ